ncbi:hypothetical protein DFH06DRAFT_1260721 [Mycena polygramma]|nr:hypothetical protein C8R47DRAFT_386245 [Mycena vitilis]KAJ7601778.1 hypothetical protein DFH06DRAFT_1260721 [Mycena polygramma]
MSVFRATYRMLQRHAHESPVLFYSVVLGLTGPAILITVPPIRRSMGHKAAEPIPLSYPLPNRPRRAVQGYEDE